MLTFNVLWGAELSNNFFSSLYILSASNTERYGS